VLPYFEANDLLPYWRQRVGHAIRLRNHVAPFLDVGDHTVVEPGMVFTIEPGPYSASPTRTHGRRHARRDPRPDLVSERDRELDDRRVAASRWCCFFDERALLRTTSATHNELAKQPSIPGDRHSPVSLLLDPNAATPTHRLEIVVT
jgi:Metallopeptidase family M24